MKKITLFGLIALGGLTSFSQEGAYISLSSGVGFATAPDKIGETNTTTSSGDFTNTNIYGTYGTGLNINLNGGFKYTQNFGVDLGISYLSGFKITTNQLSSPVSEGSTFVKGSLIKVKPSFLFASGNDALTLYARTGLVIPVANNSYTEQTLTSSGTTTFLRTESTGVFSLGYFSAFGVSFKVTDKLKVFAEAEAINLRLKQKSSVLTDFTIDGSDQLGSLNTQDKETQYEDQVTSSDNTSVNLPRKVLARTLNYSSIGFNIGVRLNF